MMKRILFPLGISLLLLSGLGSCKSFRKSLSSDVSARADSLPDRDPRFPGGEDSLRAYLEREAHYPARFLPDSAGSVVLCTFWVESDGTVSAPEVIRGGSAALDTAAVRLLAGMPAWTPAVRAGGAVRFRCAAAVRFGLDSVPSAVADSLFPPVANRLEPVAP